MMALGTVNESYTTINKEGKKLYGRRTLAQTKSFIEMYNLQNA